ncbi:MAG: two-component system response regulator [Limnobacter sp.]|uniref:response regulator n=1 Tax=Limnobacter sp. TaxID=2003368 RepID=UPI00391DDF0F
MLNNKKYTVLIVDDDPVTTAMLGSLCTSYGLNVITDTDAERALQRVADGQAQIVISDWHMQGMNGLQFCERIRSLPVGDFVYFILMSAYSEDEFIRDCILSQVDQFLPKPIESQLLRHSLFNAFRILDLKDSLGSLDLELPEQQKTLQQDLQLLRLLQLSMMPQRNQVLSGTRYTLTPNPGQHSQATTAAYSA